MPRRCASGGVDVDGLPCSIAVAMSLLFISCCSYANRAHVVQAVGRDLNHQDPDVLGIATSIVALSSPLPAASPSCTQLYRDRNLSCCPSTMPATSGLIRPRESSRVTVCLDGVVQHRAADLPRLQTRGRRAPWDADRVGDVSVARAGPDPDALRGRPSNALLDQSRCRPSGYAFGSARGRAQDRSAPGLADCRGREGWFSWCS